jgi:hypothetical protein
MLGRGETAKLVAKGNMANKEIQNENKNVSSAEPRFILDE